jgi:hypothetical protein
MKLKINVIKLNAPLLVLLILGACNTIKSSKMKPSIIEQMHAEWQGKWPKYMQFEQNVYLYKDDKLVREEVWQELMSCPQNLHIRFNGFNTGNGMLFRADSIYSFNNGEIVKEELRVHQLLLLGFDVYHQAPAITQKKLSDLGYDLTKMYEKKINEQTIIVVGTADENDLNTSQFWIDKKNKYLLRTILNRNGTQSDVTFGNYQTIDNNPVATEITFLTNKKLTMVEKYFNITFPKSVDPKVFDPANIKAVAW